MFWWTVLAGAVFTPLYLYFKYPWLKYDFQALGYLVKLLIKFKGLTRKGFTIVDIFEEKAKLHPRKTFVIFQDNNYTYEFMEKEMNKIAHTGRDKLGLGPGDTVAMLINNEPAFIYTFYGTYTIVFVYVNFCNYPCGLDRYKSNSLVPISR